MESRHWCFFCFLFFYSKKISYAYSEVKFNSQESSCFINYQLINDQSCFIIASSFRWLSLNSICHVISSKNILMCVHAQLLQSGPTLCNLIDCSPPGSFVHGILQARILEWVAMPSSRGYSQPRDWTLVSQGSCIAGRSFTIWTTREAPILWCVYLKNKDSLKTTTIALSHLKN